MDKKTNNTLAAIMLDKKIMEVTENIDRSKLPVTCFLWIGDSNKNKTWYLPYKNESGKVNYDVLYEMANIVENKKMELPYEIRTKVKRTYRKYIGDHMTYEEAIKQMPNFHVSQFLNPDSMDQNSFRVKVRKNEEFPDKSGKIRTIHLVIAKPKGKSAPSDPTTLVEFRYPVKEWTAAEARAHAKHNKAKSFKAAKQTKQESRKGKNMKYFNFTESIFSNGTLKHDVENCIVYGMSILKNESKNCSYKEGKGRKYTDRAMLSTAKLIEGAKSYINHATRKELEERGGIRDIRDLLGYFENGRIDGNIVRADLHYLKSHKNWFGPIVEQMADKVGGSIHAYGPSVFNESTKYELVEDIKVLSSTDIVTEPGSTNNLFESFRRDSENNMDYTTLTLADLKENRPDLVTEVLKGYKENAKTAKTIEEKDCKIAELDKENKSLKEQVDKYEVRDALAKKEKMISEKLEKSELPKEAVTEVFKKQLVGAKDEAAIDELIKDRKSFIEDEKLVKGMGGETKLGGDKFNLKESMKDYSEGIEGVEIK